MVELQNFANTLQDKLNKAEKIVILTHHNPDGDAIGSSLALSQVLKKMNKQVKTIVPNDFPKFLKWLPQAKSVVNAEHKYYQALSYIENADIIFCLDFNMPARIEKLEKPLEESQAYKVLIDHHQQPTPFDLMYSDTSQPATCQMIYKVIQAMEWNSLLDTDIANCLYTGLITDTGNFRYRNTTSETMHIAAELMGYDLKIDEINSNIFDNNSLGRMQLLGLVLKRIEVLPESHASLFYVQKKELTEIGFQKGDTEGFVNYGLSIEATQFTAFLSEDIQKDFVKISFRSKGEVDVNRIAREYFDGGGHLNAAGGRSELSLEDTLQKIRDILHNDSELKKQLCVQ